MTSVAQPTADTRFPAPLQGKRVLILGGSSGIGFAVASGCLASGALVHIASSKQEKIDSAVKRLESIYPELATTNAISGSVCDLGTYETQDAQLRACFEAAVKATGGPLHHIAYTAGDALKHLPLAELTPADVIARGTVRFFGAISLAKLVASSGDQFLVRDNHSSIVFTGGTNSQKPAKGWFLAAAFGTGTEGLVRGLAVDLAPVRVGMVEIGAVPTELWGPLITASSTPFAEAMRKQTLTGELGATESVAEAYLYFMKDRFATGCNIRTDGGRLLV